MSASPKVNWYAPIFWRGELREVGCETRAEAYAILTAGSLGFPVFPIDASTKEPLIKWKYGDPPATRDIPQIQKWARQWPGCNWAVLCGGGGLLAGTKELLAAGGRGGLLVLDRDAGELAELSGELPETHRVRTPKGGEHYYFTTKPDDRIPSSQSLPVKGFDIRCVDGYVLLPGSARGEKFYEVLNPGIGIAPLPDWLREKLRVQITDRDSRPPDTAKIPQATARTEVKICISNLEEAQPGDRGGGRFNKWTFRAGNIAAFSDLKVIRVRSAIRQALVMAGGRSDAKHKPWSDAEIEKLLIRSFDAGLEEKHWPDGIVPVEEADGILSERERPVEAPEPFPEEVLVGTAGTFARLYSESSEVPKEAFFFAYLTLLGSAVSKKVKLCTSLKTQPRLYTVLLGASASAKKSTAIDFAAEHFRTLFPEQRALLPEAEAEEEIGGAEAPKKSLPSPHLTMLYGMGSAEGIARILKRDLRPMTIIYDEFRSFVSKTSQEGAVGLPMLTSLYEQNNWANPTKKADLIIEDAYISILGACTTETYENMWRPQYLDIGFINRLCVVHCSRTGRVALPEPIPSAAANALKAATLAQIEKYTKRKGPTEFSLTAAADQRWKKWYSTVADTIHTDRLSGLGLRFMLLLAVTTDASEITEEIVEKVILLLDYELRVRVRVSPIAADTLLAKMEQKIRRVVLANPGITRRDLKHRVHAVGAGLKTYALAESNLKNAGEIRLDRASGTFWPIIPGAK